ncbi:hypothetical protein GGR01_000501 [Acetobacter oeni]|nr:hypothetical protein [Acetobacter oeni]
MTHSGASQVVSWTIMSVTGCTSPDFLNPVRNVSGTTGRAVVIRQRMDFLPVCRYATTSPVNAREEKGTWNA